MFQNYTVDSAESADIIIYMSHVKWRSMMGALSFQMSVFRIYRLFVAFGYLAFKRPAETQHWNRN